MSTDEATPSQVEAAARVFAEDHVNRRGEVVQFDRLGNYERDTLLDVTRRALAAARRA